ncbi:hypothetical protein PQX77_016689 [Marasmius sp. AFHP31]|nr:hypothetical protein PQX77_016689 [Marasmius sp. AFHP31]
MVTRGYKVYRYRNIKVRHFVHSDAYPKGLGIELLATIPKPSDGEGWEARFQAWLAEERRSMEDFVADMIQDYSPEDLERPCTISCDKNDNVVIHIQSDPYDDFFISYIYEIDLDNLCFLIDSFPVSYRASLKKWPLFLTDSSKVFKLDYMPPEEIFLEKIGYNNYGHRSYADSDPSEYRYVHKIVPYPKTQDQVVLRNYSESCTGTYAYHDLLGVNELQSVVVRTRVRWVEMIVGHDLMSSNGTAAYVEVKLENNCGQDTKEAMPKSSYEQLLALIWLIFLPYSYSSVLSYTTRLFPSNSSLPPSLGSTDLRVLRRDTIVHIHNHLDDLSSLRRGSYDLFRAVIDHWELEEIRFVYGILFSGTRCALVRVDRHHSTFVHTESLPFFPSGYAATSSTLGITAVARLASRIDVDFFSNFFYWPSELQRSIECTPVAAPLPLESSLFDKLPLELLQVITESINNFDDLFKFASIGTRNRRASQVASLSIFISGFRLTDVATTKDCDESQLDKQTKNTLFRYNLWSTAFTMVSNGQRVYRRRAGKLPREGICVIGHLDNAERVEVDMPRGVRGETVQPSYTLYGKLDPNSTAQGKVASADGEGKGSQ